MAAPDSSVADPSPGPNPFQLAYVTPLAGLHQILESGRIPVSEARSANASEFADAHHLAQDYLRGISATDAAIGFARDSALRMVAAAFANAGVSGKALVYSATFQEVGAGSTFPALERDPGFEGKQRVVSIVLDLSHLKRANQPNATAPPALYLAPCVPDRSEKERLLRSVLEGFLEEVARLYRRVQDQWRSKVDYNLWATVRRQSNLVFDLPTYGETVQTQFHQQRRAAAEKGRLELLQLASTFQSPEHSHDREWRLVWSSPDPTSEDKKEGTASDPGENEPRSLPSRTVDLRDASGRLGLARVCVEPDFGAEVSGILVRNGYAASRVVTAQ